MVPNQVWLSESEEQQTNEDRRSSGSYVKGDVIEGDSESERMVGFGGFVFVDDVNIANGKFQIANHLKLHAFDEGVAVLLVSLGVF